MSIPCIKYQHKYKFSGSFNILYYSCELLYKDAGTHIKRIHIIQMQNLTNAEHVHVILRATLNDPDFVSCFGLGFATIDWFK
jgi:hypothetical protein